MRSLLKGLNPLITLLTAIIFIGSGCKNKSDNNVSVDPAASLVKTVIEKSAAGDVINRTDYQYDSQKRIISKKIQEPLYGTTSITSYEYYPSLVIEKIYDPDDTLRNKNSYHLNNLGIAVSESPVRYFTVKDSLTSPDCTLEYSAEGFMTKYIIFQDDSSVYKSCTWQISDGNIYSYVYSIPTGSIYATETYSYIPGSVNSIGNINFGMMFLGRSNTNLISSSILTSLDTKTASFKYAYDSYNRVTAITVTGFTLITTASEISYTYY